MTEGWGWPWNSKQAHYFKDSMSLCNKWMYSGKLEEGKDNSPDNCKVCIKKLEKLRAQIKITES